MAPLNEENDDEDDSTLFDVKYRQGLYFFIAVSKAERGSMQQMFKKISYHAVHNSIFRPVLIVH